VLGFVPQPNLHLHHIFCEIVSGEIKEIDVFFTPNKQQTHNLQILGLLGRFAENTAII
jgi:hypothetical protein